MKRHLVAFTAGIVFSIGLGLGGMTLPERVLGFLDFTGAWDPTLAFVMAGAFLTYAIAFRRIRARARPVLDLDFSMPPYTEIDARLIVGSAIFGIGWGLVGYCPGPAITSIATGAPSALLFVAAMLTGMLLHRLYERLTTSPPLTLSTGDST